MDDSTSSSSSSRTTWASTISGRPSTASIDYIISHKLTAQRLRHSRRLPSHQLGFPIDRTGLLSTHEFSTIAECTFTHLCRTKLRTFWAPDNFQDCNEKAADLFRFSGRMTAAHICDMIGTLARQLGRPRPHTRAPGINVSKDKLRATPRSITATAPEKTRAVEDLSRCRHRIAAEQQTCASTHTPGHLRHGARGAPHLTLRHACAACRVDDSGENFLDIGSISSWAQQYYADIFARPPIEHAGRYGDRSPRSRPNGQRHCIGARVAGGCDSPKPASR